MIPVLKKSKQKYRLYIAVAFLWVLSIGSGLIACTGSCVHDWQFGKVLNENDCTEEGLAEYVCKECGETMTVTLSVLEHEENLIEEAYPTCECDGYKKYACRRCETVRIEVIPAKNHRYAKTPVTTVEANCTQAGGIKYVCEECGMEKEYRVNPLGHRYYQGVCTVCSEVCSDTVDGTAGFSYRKVQSGYLLTGRSESTDTEIVIPSEYCGEPVVGIGNAAFVGQKDIVSIKFPETIKEIGAYAFFGCCGLMQLELPGSLERLGDSAFADCTGLLWVRTAGNLTELGNSAFYGCAGLECFYAGENVSAVGRFAFTACKQLKTVYLNAQMGESLEENLDYGNLIAYATRLYIPTGFGTLSAYLNAQFEKEGEEGAYAVYVQKKHRV